MRVYLPTTLPGLSAAQAAGALPPGDGHAVTPDVREWYIAGDLEELEYAVMTEAAESSLRLLAADPDAPRRRVVLAVDLPDAAVRPVNGSMRSTVCVLAAVPMDAVASVHVDEPESADAVSVAVQALPAADAGDDDAQFLLDEAEACDLLWYDVTEIPYLV